MKNASQIIQSISYQPQFAKLLEYGCIKQLLSLLLPTYQNIIKRGFIKNQTLYFILKTNINKQDKDNIINLIKSILNFGAYKIQQCEDISISDVKLIVDMKPEQKASLYPDTISHISYKERAKAGIGYTFKEPKLQFIADEINSILRKNSDS